MAVSIRVIPRFNRERSWVEAIGKQLAERTAELGSWLREATRALLGDGSDNDHLPKAELRRLAKASEAAPDRCTSIHTGKLTRR